MPAGVQALIGLLWLGSLQRVSTSSDKRLGPNGRPLADIKGKEYEDLVLDKDWEAAVKASAEKHKSPSPAPPKGSKADLRSRLNLALLKLQKVTTALTAENQVAQQLKTAMGDSSVAQLLEVHGVSEKTEREAEKQDAVRAVRSLQIEQMLAEHDPERLAELVEILERAFSGLCIWHHSSCRHYIAKVL